MSSSQHRWTNLIILFILIAGAWTRATLYGDLRLSIAMPDTPSYVGSSAAPLFSWQAFTGERLFTTNLLYKLIPDSKCVDAPFSAPALKKEIFREIQPCFTKIVVFQNILALIGWCALAWSVARRLRRPLFKTLAAALILLFGFTPQIAEWDSVLSSETISFSMFALALALLTEIIFRLLGREDENRPAQTSLLIAAWLAVFTLWIFIRDAHLSAIAITLIVFSPLIFVKRIRRNKIFAALAILLIGFFLLGSAASRQSVRQQTPLGNAFNAYIFPHPARVEYFKERGMPGDTSSAEYKTWFQKHAAASYLKFLLAHPGFVGATLLENTAYLQSDFTQPYYKSPEIKYRNALLEFGKVFHPQSNAVFAIDAILLIGLCAAAFNKKSGESVGWAWLAAWMFLYASASLILSFFGDADGVSRHIFPAVETFRLFGWIFLTAQIDLSAQD
ncbi:MAG: hypothetical protein PHQ36_05590 [Anaerolineales bacterium]|nr:hypothetical protein [Anaerolineales bacterium]